MKRLLISLASLFLLGSTSMPAHAQFFTRNELFNSGNGAHNSVMIINGVPRAAYGPSSHAPGYAPVPYPPAQRFPLLRGLLQAVGGVNINVISGSGNGVGNSILATNPQRRGGININVIAGSGNGAHNRIGIANGR